jgi:cellulose synthase operon protein C
MNRMKRCIFFLPLFLLACQSMSNRDTIARLRHMQIDIKEEKLEGGLEKAMQGYQRFLENTPESALTPEAIRRLADLKIENEYGSLTHGGEPQGQAPAEAPEQAPADRLSAPDRTRPIDSLAAGAGAPPNRTPAPPPVSGESDAEFEKRAAGSQPLPAAASTEDAPLEGVDDLERASAREAIALYEKLLKKYPLYDRNDQVLYQMSRAYEELGQTDAAMQVMDRLVRQFPRSRYIDEVQFRRAEYFFTRRRWLDAEDAYTSIVTIGKGSFYYELALYKLGWTFYKQELYEEALHRFIALLDHKVAIGYDFAQTEDKQEHKRTQDTFRVISLSFSNLGGADSVVSYFSGHGKRTYEDSVYSNLGEFYFDKRRYADASATYNAFVSRNPFHKKAPNFHMRVIEIHAAGGFPSLVLDAKKAFASTYGLNAEYWKYFDPAKRPDVLANLKTNLTDLAHHYHARYQDKGKAKEKAANFAEALHWYREFLASFSKEKESPGINYQMADLLLENHAFGQAAVEYEKTAYGYPSHEKSAPAGYAAVFAFRKHLADVAAGDKERVKREVVRCSLKFADAFPKHDKAAIVLGAAADDLYSMEQYQQALAAAGKLIKAFPGCQKDVLRAAWLVTGHSTYELQRYPEAETAYLKVLSLLPVDDKTRPALMDNLAATIYKQGEQARAAKDYQAAADHFLRVGRMAPTSKIRAAAEYDGAAALIQLKNWQKAAAVLTGFRKAFPDHELQPEVTKKLAYVYKENKQLSAAAQEYERIERESKDDAIRREALQVAADLHARDGNQKRALAVYRRYVDYFPEPVEPNLETRNKIAEILKSDKDRESYLAELRQIVAIDSAAGAARTDRTRYLAGNAALVLAQNTYDTFVAVKLVKPLEENMKKKKGLMKDAINRFNGLLDYESGELTAAATYYLAEIYAHFSKALTTSERPELTFDYYIIKPGDNLSTIARRSHCDIGRIAHANNLTRSSVIVVGKKLKIPRGLYPEELEQYELAIEEQAYPFEEKAISVHESNLKLIARGVYNQWIDKSLRKLAVFMPARYDKPEASGGVVASLESYTFAVARPAPAAAPAAAASARPAAGQPPAQAESKDAGTAGESAAAAQAPNDPADAGTATDTDQAGRTPPPSAGAAKPVSAPVDQTAEHAQAQAPGPVAASGAAAVQ